MPTIREIAKKCGVSITAVSQAINSKGRISEETRIRVLDTIKRMKYDPASHLPAAKLAATRTIGLILPLPELTTADSFYYRAILAAIAGATEHGHSCKLFTENEIAEAVTTGYPQGRSQLGCDRIIMYCPVGDWEPSVKVLREWDMPVALIRRTTDTPGVTCLTNDDYAATCAAMEHLYASGHRSVGICATLTTTFNSQRLAAYRDSVEKFGMNDDPHLMADTKGTYENPEPYLVQVMKADPQPTALLCFSDALATRMVRVLVQRGMRVPGDMAVMGYDDDPVAAGYNPPLSTVRIPVEEMVRQAVDTLLSGPKGTDGPPERKFDCEIIVRESTETAHNADNVKA